jgi:hypothetical protein
MISEPTARVVRIAVKAIGFGMIVAACSTVAWARIGDAPEIDPGSMASALTLLTGGTLMLTRRNRRR